MFTRPVALALAATALGAAGCATDMMSTDPDAAAFLSAVPSGGAVAVPPDGPLVLQFSKPMMVGMERYVDLHRGGLADPTVSVRCTWSADRTALTCRPENSLERGTRYTLHMGGGLRDATGRRVDSEQHRRHMGGEWADSARMGGMHSGMRMGDMPNEWQHPNGSLGMAFEFLTS